MPSAGHVLRVPLQTSCTSQVSVAERQMVPAVFTRSAGQAAALPVQVST
jgi:hypothetical protein